MSDMNVRELIVSGLINCGLDKDGYTADDLSDIAEAVATALQLTPEFGWDVAGRKKPNPKRIYGNDGRPVTSQPDPGDYVRLYERLTSQWVRVEEQP